MSLPYPTIELADILTFDIGLFEILHDYDAALTSYWNEEDRIFSERHKLKGLVSSPNPHWDAHVLAMEAVTRVITKRTLRAYHYTRMTDEEVAVFRAEGVRLSTTDFFRHRLDALVAAGELTASDADYLYEKSKLHEDDTRLQGFFMTSFKYLPDEGDVSELLRYWGGEAGNMNMDKPEKTEMEDELLDKLQRIGKPRIIEMTVPIALTEDRTGGLSAAAVIATFKSFTERDVSEQCRRIDVCLKLPLPPENIVAIYTEGDAEFHSRGEIS